MGVVHGLFKSRKNWFDDERTEGDLKLKIAQLELQLQEGALGHN